MRFVIVGTGNISRTFYTAISNLQDLSVVGFVSRSERRPEYLDDEDSVDIANQLDDVAADFDAVVLATPNGLHHHGAIEAARLGKHVLTEKPLDVTVEHMDAMIEACREAGVTLGVSYQRRMSPDNQALKRLLDTGELGRVYAADVTVKVFRDQAYYDSAPYRGTPDIDGGGVYIQQASHNVDLYCWLFGMPETVVSTLGTLAHDIPVEDHGAAVMRHPNGMIGTIIASTVVRPSFPPRLELHTERGSAVLTNDVVTTWEMDGVENPSRKAAGRIHSGASVSVADTAGHEAILQDFAEAVAEGREPAVPASSARLATELIRRIYDAAAR